MQFHPRKYLLALADDLVAHGGRIFEDTRVTGVDGGSPCLVRTGDGPRITAGHVVVATHYPVLDRALLFPRLEPHRELVLAAEIPEEEDPKGMYITPEGGTRSVRTAPLRDGRRLLIVTGEGFLPGAGGVEERHRRLAAWTRERFPSARPLYRWAAQDNSTTDRLPFVGPVHPGVRNTYVATGFGGWGMSNGVMASRLLAELLTGGSAPWAGLYDPRRLRPLREAPAAARIQATVARHFVGDRLGAEPGRRAEEPAPGEGAVVRQGAGTARSTGTTTASCTPWPRGAPTWGAWCGSTMPSAPGSAPATGRGSASTGPCSRARPPGPWKSIRFLKPAKRIARNGHKG